MFANTHDLEAGPGEAPLCPLRYPQHRAYPDLLISTNFSIPCVSRSFLAASRLSTTTSLMVLRIDTTVSSERFLAGVCWPPGKFFTRLGIACLPGKGKELGVSKEED